MSRPKEFKRWNWATIAVVCELLWGSAVRAQSSCAGELAREEQFASFVLPGGPTTLLSYLQSLGVTGSAENTGEEPWSSGFASHTLTLGCSNGDPTYFQSGQAIVIQGDGYSDNQDWVVFNFGPRQYDYDGSASSSSMFGGESKYSGGGFGGFAVGRLWGETEVGWVELYSVPLHTNDPFGIQAWSRFNHEDGAWLEAGKHTLASESPYGKRPEYDTLVITELGFSVSNVVEDPCGANQILTVQGCIDACDLSGSIANEDQFASFVLPGGPSTLLDFLQSFNVSGTDANTGEEPWNSGHATFPLDSCTSGPLAYFQAGTVTLLQGDTYSDPDDWVVFNFGPQESDWDGRACCSSFFGGEADYSGGAHAEFAVGRVWGKPAGRRDGGWVELYAIPLHRSDPFGIEPWRRYDHTEGLWLQAGGAVSASEFPYGKRPEYESMVITEVGFSVSNYINNTCTGDLVLTLEGCKCGGYGYVQANGTDRCVCPFTQVSDAELNACVCPPGFFDDGSAQCLGECPPETLPGLESPAVEYLRGTAKEFVVVDRDFEGQTLLAYLQSFQLSTPWTKEPTAAWNDAHDRLTILPESSCFASAFNPYFARGGGRVLVLDGDGQAGGAADFAIFNFDVKDGMEDFKGHHDELAYFGGEQRSAGLGDTYAAGEGYGAIWGFNPVYGWLLLYTLPLDHDSDYDNANDNWWSVGGYATEGGHGKREAFDGAAITRLGFSISYEPVVPFVNPAPNCGRCNMDAICALVDGEYACQCRRGFEGDGVASCTNVNECQVEAKAMRCDALAYCIDTAGSFECQCPPGFLGDGFECANHAYAIRSVIEFQDPPTLSSDQLRLLYARAIHGAAVDPGTPLVETLAVEIVDVALGAQVTLNVLYPSEEEAIAGLQMIDLTDVDWALFGPGFRALIDGPEVYRWTGQSTSDPLDIAPSGFTLETVHFEPSCLDSGCWVVAVTYTIGTNDINAFYIPRAEGDDGLSYDFDYSSVNADWRQSPDDTFRPETHPCTSADYDPRQPLPATVTACCLKQFVDMYRPLSSLASALMDTGVSGCTTGARDRSVDKDAVPVLAGRHELVASGAMGAKSVFVDGPFEGLNASYGKAAGVIDPFVGIYKAKFYLDERELRTRGGKLRGTAGVEHTVDTFLGLINLSPTGTHVLDTFASQTAIHLEKTSFFAAATHGTNDYTFLEYVNLRLVAIYNEDADFAGAEESSVRFVRTNSSKAAHYLQVTFTLGSQYGVNDASGLIPLASVRAGHGTFFNEVNAGGGMALKCLEWTAEERRSFARQDEFNTTLQQQCAPAASMCASPSSIPDQFVAFNVPLGVDWLPEPSGALVHSVFVDMVISAVDLEAMRNNPELTPNSGEASWQMKTTLTASVPVVEGGVNIFCDGVTGKTDLKDVASVDIVLGSAQSESELARLQRKQDIATTQLDPAAATEIDSDSIEAGLMTLVLKGNSSFFGGARGVSLELEDVVTVHVMEDDGSGEDSSVASQIQALLSLGPDDNFGPDGLQSDGYALNGGFFFTVDREAQRAHLEPSEALLALCPFNPPPPPPGAAPLETCVTRRDVRYRSYPSRAGASSTAMEICANVNAGSLQGEQDRACPTQTAAAESAFFASILGDSGYARQLGLDYAAVIAEANGLNGRYRRAYWVNPAYEWGPAQTGGAPAFRVSQKIFLFALVTLDEGVADAVGSSLGARSGPTFARRMLLQGGSAGLEEAEAAVGAEVVAFKTSPKSMMAKTFAVPEERVALFNLDLQLTAAEACMAPGELYQALRERLLRDLEGLTSARHSVQLTSMMIDQGDERCGGRRQLRRLLAELSTASAAVSLLIVFKEGSDAVLDLAALAAMPGINSVVADSRNSATIDVTPGGEWVPAVTPSAEEEEEAEPRGISTMTAIIAAASAGVGLLLLGAGRWLYMRQQALSEQAIHEAISMMNVQDLKAALAEEA